MIRCDSLEGAKACRKRDGQVIHRNSPKVGKEPSQGVIETLTSPAYSWKALGS